MWQNGNDSGVMNSSIQWILAKMILNKKRTNLIGCRSSLDALTNQLIQLHACKDSLHHQEAWNAKSVLSAPTVHPTALTNMCRVLLVRMLMRHPYPDVWNVQLVTFVKIQQNPQSLVRMEHTVKEVLPIAQCALQDSGIICCVITFLAVVTSQAWVVEFSLTGFITYSSYCPWLLNSIFVLLHSIQYQWYIYIYSLFIFLRFFTCN